MKHYYIWIAVLILTACRQEISTDVNIPVVTSAFETNTPIPTSTPVFTPTPAFPLPQVLLAGPISIVAIGDDITRGDGDDLGRGYPGRLLELVTQIRPGSWITNFSQSGWTSGDLVNGTVDFSGQLGRAVSEVNSAVGQRRGSVVLVWTGEHDLWELYTGEEPVTREKEDQDVARFSGNINTIIFTLREAGAEVIIAQLDDQSQRPARTRSEIYPNITAEELDRMSLQVQRYNGVIADIANRHNALTVNFYGSDIFIKDATLASDGYHPNPAGYDLITQSWYKALIKILP
jgi:lysophospholipase L1-like esterase